MLISENILSIRTKSFFEQEPAWWIRYGSLALFFLLLFIVYLLAITKQTQNVTVPLEYLEHKSLQPFQLAKKDNYLVERFYNDGDQVYVGDTIFALGTQSQFITIDRHINVLSDTLVDKIERFNYLKSIPFEDIPIQLLPEFEVLFNSELKTVSSLGISTNAAKRIRNMEAEVIVSMKKQEALKKSIKTFERRMKEADTNLQEARVKYRDPINGVSTADLKKLIDKFEEQKGYKNLRVQELRTEERLVRNFVRQIDSAKAKKRTNRFLPEGYLNKLDSLTNNLMQWQKDIYILSEHSGILADCHGIGDVNQGDTLGVFFYNDHGHNHNHTQPHTHTNTHKEIEGDYEFYFTLDSINYQTIRLGQELEITYNSDSKESIMTKSKVIGKYPLFEGQEYRVTIEPNDNLNPLDNTNWEVYVHLPEQNRSFFSNLWRNFKF